MLLGPESTTTLSRKRLARKIEERLEKVLKEEGQEGNIDLDQFAEVVVDVARDVGLESDTAVKEWALAVWVR